MVPYAMRHYDRESRAETRSPAVWCMQLGKCDPYPARCWKQKLVVPMFRSLLPLWFRVSAWRHVGVGVVKEILSNRIVGKIE